jgi:hypothetical protein
MQDNKVDYVLVCLMAGMLFFTFVLLFTEWKYPNDGQVYQTFAGLLTSFSGAFIGRIMPGSAKSAPPPDAKITKLTVTEPPSTDH